MCYLVCLLLVNKLRRTNLVSMFRIGIFLNLAQCIILLIAGDKISNYIIPFAVFASIGNAFYYYPQQILIKRVNKESNFQNYITKDQILKYTINILLPINISYLLYKQICKKRKISKCIYTTIYNTKSNCYIINIWNNLF